MSKRIIDISEHNGLLNETLMNKIKSNCEGLIIRCGYGSDYSFQDDKQFNNNHKLAVKLNIPCQFYLFSYALNTLQAKSEAQHVNRLLPQNSIIYFDIEDETVSKLDKKELKDIVLTFINNLRKDIQCGVYCGWYNYTNKLSFINELFPPSLIWVADYSFNHKGYNQQFTSEFRISGISCNFDMSDFIEFTGYNTKEENKNPNVINEKGVGTVLADVLNVRNEPNTNSKIVANYYKGEKVNYDMIVVGNEYVWLSYISWSGQRRYVASRVISTNEKYIEYKK